MAEPVPGKYNAAHFFKRKNRVVSKKGKRDQNLKYRFTILMAQKSPHIVQPSVSAGIRSARICLARAGFMATANWRSQSRSRRAWPISRSAARVFLSFTMSPTWAAIRELMTPSVHFCGGRECEVLGGSYVADEICTKG